VETLGSTLHILREPVGLQADPAGEDWIPSSTTIDRALNSAGGGHHASRWRREEVIVVVVRNLADDLPILPVHSSQELIIPLCHPAMTRVKEPQVAIGRRVRLRVAEVDAPMFAAIVCIESHTPGPSSSPSYRPADIAVDKEHVRERKVLGIADRFEDALESRLLGAGRCVRLGACRLARGMTLSWRLCLHTQRRAEECPR